MSQFTTEEIQMLAEAEQMMDSGKAPYVMLDGHRMMQDTATMQHFGLVQGQTITIEIQIALLNFKIAACQAMIEAKKRPN